MTEIELTRRERKKEETKAAILKAAFDLFKRRGVAETTIEEICEKADIAKGTFFNYFPRKEAVFGYLSLLWMADVEKKVGDLLQRRGHVWDKLLDVFIGDCASYYEEDRVLSRHIVQEWTRGMYEADNDVCCRWDALGQRVIRHLQETGELRRDVSPERAHRLMSDIYHSTMVMWLEPDQPPFNLKDELRQRLTLVIEGLAPRASEA